jgi:hypothetical protein
MRSENLKPVRCIFVHVYFPHLLGGFLHNLTCTCNYMLWPLAPGNTTCLFLTWYQSARFRSSPRSSRRRSPRPSAAASGRRRCLSLAVGELRPSLPLLFPGCSVRRRSRSDRSDRSCRRPGPARPARLVPSLSSARGLVRVVPSLSGRPCPICFPRVAPTFLLARAADPAACACCRSGSCAWLHFQFVRGSCTWLLLLGLSCSCSTSARFLFVLPPRPLPDFTEFCRRSPEKVAAGGN